jgi:pimeloyl-ACP methyl ester carboxylesterase
VAHHDKAGVKPIVFAGCGHYLHVEQPDAVINTLNAWRNTIGNETVRGR